jgi:hypothetical protein
LQAAEMGLKIKGLDAISLEIEQAGNMAMFGSIKAPFFRLTIAIAPCPSLVTAYHGASAMKSSGTRDILTLKD